ncbi:MAG TPA: murein biosynthesis integral membrane protein MurJ [Caulobacteraceae bacterium]|nr:murein biosynthesis integral membrane protein MurJ [Caulobacteraceae bacterium]
MTIDPAAAGPAAPAQVPRARPGMIRSSMIYSGFTLISRMMGFVRDLVVTYYMGASATFVADAYTTALAFPNLFRRIFAEGAFAAAFVPAYSRSLEQDGEEVADVLAADAMAALLAMTVALTVFAELAMPWIIYLYSPGFAAVPGKIQLTITLTMITMPYLPCMAIYAHLAGVLNARNRFVLSAGAPILLNVWTLVAVLPTHSPRQAAVFASWGVLIAGVTQAALLWWGVRRSGANVNWRLPRLTPEIRRLIGLALPGAFAASVQQVNVFVSQFLVSHVNGARAWLAVCDRLYQLPQGLVGVSIGVALLPRLSRAVHSGDTAEAGAAMDQAVTVSMALTLPAAAALAAMPFFLVDGLYTRGEFRTYDALRTAQALQQYGWGVPAFVLAALYSRAFFARQDTRTPMNYAVVSVVVNVIAGIVLFHLIGVAGIAAATSLAAWLNVAMMAATLARRGEYAPSARARSKLIRIFAASVALGLLLAGAAHERALLEAPLAHIHLGPLHAKEMVILAVTAAAACVYPVLLFASGGLTLAELRGVLRRGAAPLP